MIDQEMRLVLSKVRLKDNRKLDEAVADDWLRTVERQTGGRATLADCLAAVDEWFDAPRENYFRIADMLVLLKKRLRLTDRDIAVDARVALSMGLITEPMPRGVPIPADIAVRLAAVRAGARENAVEAIEGGAWVLPKGIEVKR